MGKSRLKQQKRRQKAQEKIRKLRKVHIWPSVIFLICAQLVTFTFVAGIESLLISYIIQEKFDGAVQSAEYIETKLTAQVSKGIKEQSALSSLTEDIDYDGAIAILDDNNEILASQGDMSYELSRRGSVLFDDTYNFCLDKNTSENIFNKSGLFVFKPKYLIEAFFGKNGFMKDDWLNTEVIREPYWIIIKGNTKNNTVLVRNELILTSRDIMYIYGSTMGLLIVIIVPLIFLFCHVISSMRKQRQMYQLLSVDSATYGNNWFSFTQRAEKLIGRYVSKDQCFAIVHFSYGKYRNFCSCYGVSKGEKLLQQIDQYLTDNLGKKEFCAYTSEADFALLICCNTQEEVSNRVISWFHGIMSVIPQYHVSFCAGICMVDPRLATEKKSRHAKYDVAQLYHFASIAKDRIDASKQNAILFFDDTMRDQQLWEHKVEESMEGALLNEEFQVYLQPKYNPITNELTGAEALVRWISPENGFVSPGKFIPIFEKDGFIIQLDDYMISHVAAIQMNWLAQGRRVVPVSVNVSRAHFTKPGLAEHICQLVDEYNLPHELLEIELTESAFFDDKEVLLTTVNSLRDYGFLVSMDDFGAGYSSLNSLKELPLDVLKLDAEFFRGRYDKERGEIVVSEAIRLAKSLNMKIVAEGIEEEYQVAFLANLGCDMIQGYYFAKPMPINEFETRLEVAGLPYTETQEINIQGGNI